MVLMADLKISICRPLDSMIIVNWSYPVIRPSTRTPLQRKTFTGTFSFRIFNKNRSCRLYEGLNDSTSILRGAKKISTIGWYLRISLMYTHHNIRRINIKSQLVMASGKVSLGEPAHAKTLPIHF